MTVMMIVVTVVAVSKPENGHIVVRIVVSVNVAVVMMPRSISECRQHPSSEYCRGSRKHNSRAFHRLASHCDIGFKCGESEY